MLVTRRSTQGEINKNKVRAARKSLLWLIILVAMSQNKSCRTPTSVKKRSILNLREKYNNIAKVFTQSY